MKFKLDTQHPIAYESRDHTDPSGTKNDNSRWHAFNDKLYKLEWYGDVIKPLRILDLGCSGGGFVADCIKDGHIAVGLEGSDYSLKHKRAEWATIPDNLFTCDVTKTFKLFEGLCESEAQFDVITGWEFLEHIWEKELPGLLDNCLRHLKPNGLMIFSINNHAQYHHVCLHDKRWWLDFFDKNGLTNRTDLIKYFGNDWIRGPMQHAIGSFHVILERK